MAFLRFYSLLNIFLLCYPLRVVHGIFPAEREIASSYIDNGMVKSSYITVSSAKIHYLSSGPDISQTNSNSQQKIVLFCHGASFTSNTWKILGILDELGSSIGQSQYTTLALDLPGFGQSEPLKPLRLATSDHEEVTRYSFISRFLLALNVSPNHKNIAIISASMGGTYAIPFISNPKPFNHIAGYITVAGNLPRSLIGGPQQNPPPTLVIFGDQDPRMKTDKARYQDMFPRSDVVIFKNAPHPAYLRDRAAARLFNDLVLQFVGSSYKSSLPDNEKQFHVGALIESSYFRGEIKTNKYFPATITKVHGDATYDLSFKSGDYLETKVPAQYLRTTAYEGASVARSNDHEVMPQLSFTADW